MSLQSRTRIRLTYRQKVSWSAHLAKAMVLNHHRELETLFQTYIPSDGVVIDVGAHAGQFSKLFSRLARHGLVYAVEPSAYALSILQPALRWNRIRNVEVVPIALSDLDGRATLHTPLTARGSLGFGRAGLGAPSGARRHLPQIARLQKLDTFADARKLARLDFLKADVEGWELHVLRGGLETLRRFRPTLYMEVSEQWLRRAGGAPSDLWDLLRPLGYTACRVDIERGAPVPTPARVYSGPGDYLFVGDPGRGRESEPRPGTAPAPSLHSARIRNAARR